MSNTVFYNILFYIAFGVVAFLVWKWHSDQNYLEQMRRCHNMSNRDLSTLCLIDLDK